MTFEEMPNGELLDEFKRAVENLPGSGASGRSWYYEVKEELEDRLSDQGVE